MQKGGNRLAHTERVPGGGGGGRPVRFTPARKACEGEGGGGATDNTTSRHGATLSTDARWWSIRTAAVQCERGVFSWYKRL